MRRKLIVAVSCVILALGISISVSADNRSNVVAVFDGEQITNEEFIQIKAELPNADHASDEVLLQRYAEGIILEKLFEEKQITLTEQERADISSLMNETIAQISQASEDDSPEAGAARETLEAFTAIASEMGLSAQQYVEQVSTPYYELLAKKAKLIDAEFNSSNEQFDEYIQAQLDETLAIY